MCVSNIKTSKKGVESIFYSTFSPILIIPHYSLETIIKENWPRVSSSDFTLRAKFCIKKLTLKYMNYFFLPHFSRCNLKLAIIVYELVGR